MTEDERTHRAWEERLLADILAKREMATALIEEHKRLCAAYTTATTAGKFAPGIAEELRKRLDGIEAVMAKGAFDDEFLPGPWFSFGGGACPVDPDVVVQYRDKGGLVGSQLACKLRWSAEGRISDIVSYRVLPKEVYRSVAALSEGGE